jgi:hypothetical protein
MHPTSIFDLVLRDHERRLAEAAADRERALTPSRSAAIRAARSGAVPAAGRPPDPALLHAALLRSCHGGTPRGRRGAGADGAGRLSGRPAPRPSQPVEA